MRVMERPTAWANGASLSGFIWFGAEAPNGIDLPAGMDGNRLALVRARTGADGNVDAATAEDILDITGAKLTLPITAAGNPIVFDPILLRGLGWIGLRSELSNGNAQAQAAARTATWLGVTAY